MEIQVVNKRISAVGGSNRVKNRVNNQVLNFLPRLNSGSDRDDAENRQPDSYKNKRKENLPIAKFQNDYSLSLLR